MLKNYIISFLYFLIFISLSLLLYTIFIYFDVFSSSFLRLFKYIIIILSVFISSFILGRSSNKKGYIEGIKFGVFISLFFFLITVIFDSFSFKIFLYYLIIILVSCIGSMFGINKKKEA